MVRLILIAKPLVIVLPKRKSIFRRKLPYILIEKETLKVCNLFYV